MICCSGTSFSIVMYKCDSKQCSQFYSLKSYLYCLFYMFFIFNSLANFLHYSCDLWGWLFSWNMSYHKYLIKYVSCWLYYLIILVYMVAVCYKVLPEALVVIITALRHESRSQPLPSVPFLVHYSLIILALDAVYLVLLAMSLHKPYINKITLGDTVLCHVPEDHDSVSHHC